ncbi:MAG: 50S ribosomal protein L4 [bacterium]
MKLTVYDTIGQKSTAILELDPKVFGEKVNTALLAQAIRIYTENSHQGTSKVKTRGEVNGSTRKIYRQKGTGNARHGAKYAPIFVGGGVAHGPTGVRTDPLILPQKMRKAALASALLLKVQDESIIGLKDANKADGKTGSVIKLLSNATNHPKRKVLVITKGKTEKLFQSLQNIQNVMMKRASLVSAFDIIAADKLLITKLGLSELVGRVSK